LAETIKLAAMERWSGIWKVREGGKGVRRRVSSRKRGGCQVQCASAVSWEMPPPPAGARSVR